MTEQVRYTNTVTLPDKEIALEYLARNNYTLFNTLISVIWNGIYEKDFLQKNNFYFDEEIKTGMEDYLFNLQVLPRAENIKMIRDCLFTPVSYTHLRPPSQTEVPVLHIRSNYRRKKDVLTPHILKAVRTAKAAYLEMRKPHLQTCRICMQFILRKIKLRRIVCLRHRTMTQSCKRS